MRSCRRVVVLPFAVVSIAFAIAAPLSARAAAGHALRVRASEATAPCVEAALKASPVEARIEVGSLRGGPAADVIVGASTEIDRALESGSAFVDSDEDLAAIPWVLVTRGDVRASSLGQLAQANLEVAVLAGPEAYDAKRTLVEAGARLREVEGPALRQAVAALAPKSLAGSGPQVEVDVRPLRARAAVLRAARDAEAARALVRYLSSPAGRRAFSTCTEPR
jgi:hypothetical protein